MLKIYGIYSSDMVLQRNMLNCLSGNATPGSLVTLNFRNKTYKSNCDDKGDFNLEFESGKEGGPFKLLICNNDDEITFENIMVGEVWLLSGQSNAQLTFERLKYKYPDEFNNCCSSVRMITVPIAYSFDGEKKSVQNPKWEIASTETLSSFSGTGYFFAKKLSQELNLPVGIINASQGGCNIVSWLDYESLEDLNRTELCEKIDKWRIPGAITQRNNEITKATSDWYEKISKIDKGCLENWDKIDFESLDSSWEKCVIPSDFKELKDNGGVIWFKKEFSLTKEQVESLNKSKTFVWVGTIQDADKVWINGEYTGETGYCYPPRRYFAPEKVFVEGKNTITVRVQKNSAWDIRFFEEKPYKIFNDEYTFDISGEWKKKTGCICETCPEGMFFEWEPSALYNSMLSPCFNNSFRGVLWYQGESNAGNPDDYNELLQKMISLWHSKFSYAPKDFPFVIVQLPNWLQGYKKEFPDNGGWPVLREQQLKCVTEISNTGLAVTIDCGEWNDLHPENKQTVGERSAFEALRLSYGKKYAKSPRSEYCEKNGRMLKIRFDCDGSSLVAKNSSDNEIHGFEFLSKSGQLFEANAKLVNETDVEVYVPEKLTDIKELRYLWKQNPWNVNLYNKQGVPATPFRINL